jgi:surface antigen
MKRLIFLGIAGLILAACQTSGPKQTGGTLLGAGLGALAGSQIGSGTGQLIAIGAGTLFGATLGSSAGQSLDRADQVYLQRGQQTPPPQQVPIASPAANYAPPQRQAYIPPVQSPQAAGRDCERLQSGGFACQASDGRWSIFR